MIVQNVEKSYGAPTVTHQAGRVPDPEPRRGPPLATGVQPKGNRNARPTLRSKKCSSGKTNKKSSEPKSTEGKSLPQSKAKKLDTLNVIQFNVCGLSTKKFELSNVLHQRKIHVALLQETQHTDKTNIEITGYTHYPCDCKNCQGAITYLRNDIVGSVVNINTIQPTILQKFGMQVANSKFIIFITLQKTTST